jgi:3-oxoacyl-[acyl-carrier-protein] synthase III
MVSILAFGRYLPGGVRGNQELAGTLGCEAEWILQLSGIEERRIGGALLARKA